jgi:hypothetical protein
MNQNVLRTLILLVALLSPITARAVTLDWDGVLWAPGSLNNSYEVDPLSAGDDITVAVTGDTSQLGPKAGSQTPALLNVIEGGLSPAQNVLALQLDLANQSQFVTVTMTFSGTYTAGLTDVSFSLFDVDFSNVAGSTFQDQIRSITALSIDGSTLIAPTITISATHTLSGAGVNQMVTGISPNPDTGAGSGAGNVTIDFGSNAIQSFTFTYGSGPGTVADPTGQSIGIHDLSFTPVPEANPAWLSVLSCIAAGGFVLRHRACVRK